MKRTKFVRIIMSIILVALILSGCASTARCTKTWDSDISGGLDRVMRVYAHNGTLLETYEGKIDIVSESGVEVLFDLNGKRNVVNNAIVITEEK